MPELRARKQVCGGASGWFRPIFRSWMMQQLSCEMSAGMVVSPGQGCWDFNRGKSGVRGLVGGTPERTRHALCVVKTRWSAITKWVVLMLCGFYDVKLGLVASRARILQILPCEPEFRLRRRSLSFFYPHRVVRRHTALEQLHPCESGSAIPKE